MRARILGIAAAASAVVALIVVPRITSMSASEARVIHVAARDMAFTAGHGAATNAGASADVSNPPLRVRRGEHVRIVFRNQDAGIVHDIGVDGSNARTGPVAPGEEASLQYRVPATKGEQSYSCALHGVVMRGTILIE